MTTIVATKTEIACDLQVTYNGRQPLKVDTKIERVEGPLVNNLWGAEEAFIGFAGTMSDWGNVLAWLRDQNLKVPRIKNTEFLVLTNRKQIWYSDNFNNWSVYTQPHAIGSGGPFALGAISAGSGVEEAIKVASKHDVFTGLGCKVYSF